MKKAKKSSTKKVKHGKAEGTPGEAVVPGAAESPATPQIAATIPEPAGEPEVAGQEVAIPETPTSAGGGKTGDAGAGEGQATPEAAATDATTEPVPEASTGETSPPAPAKEKLSKLDLPVLQARYREVVGRDTKSTSRGYLVWKIREAQKGKVRIGPSRPRANDAVPTKVLPLRVPAAAVSPLDEVRRRLGLRSRNEMFQKAMAAFLINAGESDLAGHFGATFTPDDADAE